MIYKDIKGYEGLYKISEFGDIIRLNKEVKSLKSLSGVRVLNQKKLKPQTNKGGYLYTQLVDRFGDRNHHFIHQLVAKTFLENPNNLYSINHKDENKINNHYSNLEWCTIKYNNLYNNRQLKINEKLQDVVKSKKAIQQYSVNNILIKEFKSINEACRELKIFKQGLSPCLHGKKSKYKGYIWKFKE